MNTSPLSAQSRSSQLAWLALLAVALIAPIVTGFDRYLLHVGITICFNVALVASLWLIWTLGVISFAHAGFMGIGAYVSALLLTKLGLSLWYGIWADWRAFNAHPRRVLFYGELGSRRSD